ncbi:ComF family protein [uncultured Desulfosarcina sp.]|uniref:ComF family protein n=1 Tax=uncultured Desulfosarcina sp. TaxID=218289 RepID=UPI0029C945BE|nr:ComF family protein [uncultured Desulfosarcina sp.]
MKPLLAAIANALFPARCMGCGQLFRRQALAKVDENQEPDAGRALADYFCPACSGQWTAVTSPLCSRCGMVFKSRVGPDHFCGRCLERPGAFTRARAAGVYDGSLRLAIQALKFKGHTRLANPLGRLLYKTYRRYWPVGDIDLIAPVPLYRRRFRRRGFNQAFLLVKAWPLAGKAVVVRDLLARNRATPPQTGLDRRQRRINIKNAFCVSRPGESAGKRILLVDDVLTTGATAEACAAALLKDGAKRVDVLTLARA